MKVRTALITTTINVPTVLSLYRACDPDVMFFIAGDRKTDDIAVTNFLMDIPNHAYYGIDVQHKLGYKCSPLLGENTITRRNIMLLEALKWGADVIVSVDDDNVPLEDAYFNYIRWAMRLEWSGLCASSPQHWVDVGQLLEPKASHRGFPYDVKPTLQFNPIVNAKIGVAAGICMGDPDIDATTRIVDAPIVTNVSELLRSGIVVDNSNWTVFNTQNTAFLRKFAPAMFCAPGFGRFDDIFASLITQRIMREKGYHVHFGKPFVWQQRNKHNLIDDLQAEFLGMKWITSLAHILDAIPNPTVRQIYEVLAITGWCPPAVPQVALAFLDDCEKVL